MSVTVHLRSWKIFEGHGTPLKMDSLGEAIPLNRWKNQFVERCFNPPSYLCLLHFHHS